MKPTRRQLLKSACAAPAMLLLPRSAFADIDFAPVPGPWRTFETTMRVEIAKPGKGMQAWLPVPSHEDASWTKPLDNAWTGNAASAEIKTDGKYGAKFLHATWADAEAAPVIELKSRFQTRDRSIDTRAPSGASALSADQVKLHTAATDLAPTGGIVGETALKIVAGAKTDLDKARAIYEWIVDHTFRDPKTRGCGTGDLESMLKTGNLGGKCADLNALYVGLARAAGLPARDIYGLRVAPSKFGYKSLGPSTELVTKAQHCRAEVFIGGIGWLPVDPADVRKVVLEEPPGNLALTDPKVAATRRVLFGAWETNWLAYNSAHDISLPGSKGPKVPFLMYPQAEVGGERLDSLAPDDLKYKITAREISA